MEIREREYRFHLNRFRSDQFDPAWLNGPGDVEEFHRSLPGYAPTPLVALPGLAANLGLGGLWVKDEGDRCGLPAFKVLGGSYAAERVMRRAGSRRPGQFTFTTATDGNHGRAVAWAARRLGQKAVIFVPEGTAAARISAIQSEGAEVVVVAGTYDDTVRRAAAEAKEKGRQVISDTAYQGYMEIPGWVVEGYTTLFAEADRQFKSATGGGTPDVVLLQAGVGGLACAGTLFYFRSPSPRPTLVAVEPTDADCLFESITSPDGSIREARGKQRSIMAGLNCGIPSLWVWPKLRAGLDAFLAIDDRFAEEAMRRLYHNAPGDSQIEAGESGAAGLAGLLALCREPGLAEARNKLCLSRMAKVLVINTESATDPVAFRRIVGEEEPA